MGARLPNFVLCCTITTAKAWKNMFLLPRPIRRCLLLAMLAPAQVNCMRPCLGKFVESAETRFVYSFLFSCWLSCKHYYSSAFHCMQMKALGCNFGATTCESCKAFFRRNALKGKVCWYFWPAIEFSFTHSNSFIGISLPIWKQL